MLLWLLACRGAWCGQDWFDDPLHNKESGENRVATVLMYLGEVSEGGETTLPLGLPIDEERQKIVNPSECVALQHCSRPARMGVGVLPSRLIELRDQTRNHVVSNAPDTPSPLCACVLCRALPSPTGECVAKGTMAVVPRRGDALLFWDMHPNGTDVDRASLHASCPTIQVCGC
jgi:hypothetical protein